jgi:hypothetical protein
MEVEPITLESIIFTILPEKSLAKKQGVLLSNINRYKKAPVEAGAKS